MILVDERVGSRHYVELLGECTALTRLESADVAFAGNSATVGIEIKKILDAVNCLYSGRLADHQIPLMKQQYDVCYLVIEGLWRSDPESGVLQYYKGELGKWGSWKDATIGQRRLMYTAFESWLSSMENLGGVKVRSSPSQETTVDLLRSLYSWWQKDTHDSFKVLQRRNGNSADLTRPSMLRRMIALLPRVGWERSAELSRRFHSVKEMVSAPAEAWFIPNEIALPTAKKIVEALNGEDSNFPL